MLANDALKAAKPYLPKQAVPNSVQKIKDQSCDETCQNGSKNVQERLWGRYGALGYQMIRQYDEQLFSPIENTKNLWAEICYANCWTGLKPCANLIFHGTIKSGIWRRKPI